MKLPRWLRWLWSKPTPIYWGGTPVPVVEPDPPTPPEDTS